MIIHSLPPSNTDADSLAEWLFQAPPEWKHVSQRFLRLSNYADAVYSAVVRRVKEVGEDDGWGSIYQDWVRVLDLPE